MTLSFFHALQSEWIKKKRSLASWIVVVGGFFTAIVIIIARLVKHDGLQALYQSDNFWKDHWKSSWESMAIFLMPLSVILSTSLITQLEFKNNTWKQLHTLPVSFTTVFFSKLTLILIMLLQFFVLFNLGIYLSAVIPSILIPGVSYPKGSLPHLYFLRENLLYFICCLPIVALQYLISLRYKNFLVPVGVGFMLWIGAISALSWKYGYVIPYTYCMYNYLKGGTKVASPNADIYTLSLVYFMIITTVSYLIYINRKEKG